MSPVHLTPEEKKFLCDCIAARSQAMGELVTDAEPGREQSLALGNVDMAANLLVRLSASRTVDLLYRSRELESAG